MRRAGHRYFAIGMKHILRANWTQEDRTFPGGSKKLNAGVDLRNIHQLAGAQLYVFVSFVIQIARQVVVDAGRHVAPVRGRQRLARGRFKVHQVQRVFWIGQHFIQCVGLPRRGRHGGKQGTGSDKLEEVTPIS